MPSNCLDIQSSRNIGRGDVSWSIYKQMMSAVQPKKLSCMTTVDDVVSTRSMGVRAKMKEMQQLEKDIQTFIDNETPIERIKRSFRFNKTTGKNSPHHELLRFVMNTSAFIGFGVGSYKGFYMGREEFMKANKLTMFATKGAASKRRAQHQFKCFIKEGALLALKTGAFVTFLCGTYLCLECYMNKSKPWTLALALGTTGSLVKIGLGPKGMFSGFLIGSFIGSFGGLMMYTMLKSSNSTQEEINYREVKALLIAKRRFDVKEISPVEEYHEEVDDIE